MLSKFLNFIGIFLMAAVILAALPLTLTKLLGFQIYGILTESMEPEFPQGCAVYVKPAQPGEIQVGDVITFQLGSGTNVTKTHRVMEIDTEKQQFITKGDANATADVEPIRFSQLEGKVVGMLPWLGGFSRILHTGTGTAVCIGVFVLAFVLWKTAEKIKLKESRK